MAIVPLRLIPVSLRLEFLAIAVLSFDRLLGLVSVEN
jgi:hypothetical protein